ncbi:MAG: MATE family efflux transporter [Desulfurococcales archaeon]|nr:MATE family efflux transporter [Desulfurococcales archaeon]
MRIRTHPLTREIIKISWPMIISELSDSIYSVTDTYFVSKLGTIALGAVGIGSYLSWTFFVVIALFSTGVLIYASQSYGSGDIEKVRHSVGETLVYATAVAFIVGVTAYYFSPALISLIAGKNTSVINDGVAYFSVRILGLPILAFVVILDSTLRAIGATRYSMIAILSSVAINIVLDPLLIFGLLGFPKLGVVGAALATVISIAYMIPVELYLLSKLGVRPIPEIKLEHIGSITKIGLPAASERLVFSMGHNIYLAFIARCGSIALAAHQIGVRIESFIYMPGYAFSVASSTLVGQRIGAGRFEEAMEVGWRVTRIAILVMAALGVIVAATSQYIVAPFSPTDDVAILASIYLILAGLSEPGLALAMALSGAIRGGGNTLIPMIISISGLYLFRILPALYLINLYGVVGAWIAMFIDVYLRGIVFTIIYKKYFLRLAKKVI